VACTVYAKRNRELFDRYRNNRNTTNPNFNVQFNAVFLLLGTKRLSRHGTILCGQFIEEMSDSWTEKDQLEMIDQLRDRQARAWKKWEARIGEITFATYQLFNSGMDWRSSFQNPRSTSTSSNASSKGKQGTVFLEVIEIRGLRGMRGLTVILEKTHWRPTS